MSADNWAICPRCTLKREAELAAARVALNEAYGKVPVAEFDQMRADLGERLSTAAPQTFREDWEIGMYDDEFYVDYRGACSDCGLRHQFKHSETVS